MKLMQFTGPWKAGQIVGVISEDNITAPSRYDREYVHIGIQVPDSPHIAYIPIEARLPVLKIEALNGETETSSEYFINYADSLEFTDLADKSYRITALQNLPAETIIDIAYDTLDI